MKSLIALLWLMNSHAFAASCQVLMIDLNNSGKEVEACREGANNNVWVLNGSHGPINAKSIEKKVQDIQRHHGCIDSIVISGHDGNGQFFGENGGVLSSELAEIVHNHPRVENTLTTMALWGCYTTNDKSCENFWMKNISPNIKATMGFTVRSPSNERPGDAALLKQYCQRRGEIAEAASKDAINQLFSSIDGINQWQVGICMQDGLCAAEYHATGEKNTTCYHSYEELHRCEKFDPRLKKMGALMEEYKKYLSAEKGHEDVPCDRADDYVDTRQSCSKNKKESVVRQAYDLDELFAQCAGRFHTETGYHLPDPEQMIRLIKFPLVKANFAYHEKAILADYNAKMEKLNLRQDTLNDLDRMNRAEVVTSTSSAVADLERLTHNTPPGGLINGVDPSKMLVMAQGLDLALRELDGHCTDFSWVHTATKPAASPCLARYGRKPTWPPNPK